MTRIGSEPRGRERKSDPPSEQRDDGGTPEDKDSDDVDEAGEESFPASDPPSWT